MSALELGETATALRAMQLPAILRRTRPRQRKLPSKEPPEEAEPQGDYLQERGGGNSETLMIDCQMDASGSGRGARFDGQASNASLVKPFKLGDSIESHQLVVILRPEVGRQSPDLGPATPLKFNRRPLARRRRFWRASRWRASLLPLLVVLVCWSFVCIISEPSFALTRWPELTAGSKLELWKSLLSNLNCAPRTEDDEATAAAELLATKLANWSDQTEAALLYLDLLSTKRGAVDAIQMDADDSDKCAGFGCQRVSLAELSSDTSQYDDLMSKLHLIEIDQTSSDNNKSLGSSDSQLKQLAKLKLKLIQLNELPSQSNPADQTTSGGQRVSASVLESRAQLAAGAELAVENANLVSRLLIHAELASIGASRRFFQYLLTRKMQSSVELAGEPSSNLVHSIGLAFFQTNGRDSGVETGQAKAEAGAGVDVGVGLSSSSSSDSAIGSSIAKLKTSILRGKLVYAPLVRRPQQGQSENLELLDLAKHPIAANSSNLSGYLNPLRAQPFLSKWLLADELPEVDLKTSLRLADMRRRLEQPAPSLLLSSRRKRKSRQVASARQPNELHPSHTANYSTEAAATTITLERERRDTQRQAGNGSGGAAEQVGLNLRDGRWFSPYFDCGVSNRWLLTYSVPFFASASSNDQQFGNANHQPSASTSDEVPASRNKVALRGISFVSFDVAKAKLVDQCTPEAGAAFLAGTNKCARILGGQCLRLESFAEMRGGGYVCQCPLGELVSSSERQQNELKRDQLVSQLTASPIGKASQAIGLNLLQAEGQFSDKNLVAKLHFVRNQRRLKQSSSVKVAQLLRKPPERLVQNETSQYFELGAQLDLEAKLELLLADSSEIPRAGWLLNPLQTSSKSGGRSFWPPLQCRKRRSSANCRSNAKIHNGKGSNGSGNSLDHGSKSGDASRLGTIWMDSQDANLALLNSVPITLDKPQQIELDLRPEGVQEQEEVECASSGEASSPMANDVRPIIILMQSICFLITLILMIILVRVRKSRIVLASGWLMLQTILLGALLLYASVFVRAWQPASSLSCLLEQWLRELGFSLFYGSVLIKLYRILTEFQSRKAHRVCLRDRDQIAYLLGLVLVVIGYMSAWTALMLDGFIVSGPNNSLDQRQQHSSPTLAEGQLSWPEVGPSSQKEEAGHNSLGDLFSGLLDTQLHYDQLAESLVYSTRCRKLTWDYVTQLSELMLLMLGLRIVYKLRNASSDTYKEKLVLSGALLLELLISALAYCLRDALWDELDADQMLLLYFVRCQLTVSLTLLLVFGPKLWSICKSKQSSLFCSLGRNNHDASSAANKRHRCHISCELHEHHLNDAVSLHQAITSNSALDIGHINLADMDPNEIRAELKRLYTQLELLKTKSMRKENPHISKRRGGRKSSHRKFSLQAFHPKHLGGASHHVAHSQASSSTLGAGEQCEQMQTSSAGGTSATTANLTSNSQTSATSDSNSNPLQRQNLASASGAIASPFGPVAKAASAGFVRLSVPEETDEIEEALSGPGEKQAPLNDYVGRSNRLQTAGAEPSGSESGKLASKRTKQATAGSMNARSQHRIGKRVPSADPSSTSSAAGVCFEDDPLAYQDSQSSGCE